MKVTLPRLALMVAFTLACVGLTNAQGRVATVISTRANLRETPSQSGQVKQEVPVGSEIRVLDNKGAWYVVRIADAVGWMHGNTFRFTSNDTAEQTRQSDVTSPTRTENTSRPSRTRADSVPTDSSSQSNSASGLIRGPRGGCYHYSKSGRKVYVDRSRCN
jgi:uncharacterized protein YgiM (DUF1202 family)